MKFITPLLTLVTASTIYANNIYNFINSLNKRDIGHPTLECASEVDKIIDCYYIPPTTDNAESVCKKIKSEFCEKFYRDPFSMIPSCRGDSVYTKHFQSFILDNIKKQYYFACQKDENGNPCPYSEILLKENLADGYEKPLSESEKDDLKKRTCQSEICREATHKAFTNFNEISDKIKKIMDEIMESTESKDDDIIYVGKEEAADYMETKECKALSNGSSPSYSTPEEYIENFFKVESSVDENKKSEKGKDMNGSSDFSSSSSSLKISTGFFISIGLLLLFIY